MQIKNDVELSSTILKTHVNQYAIIGLLISLCSIVIATLIVSYQLTGTLSVRGIYLAQTTNPAIWALDLTPFMFAYWGQAFCYGLASKAESILEDKEKEFQTRNSDLKLKLQYESNYDKLTHLPNRRLLTEKIDQAISQSAADNQLAVIILNINNFKQINYNLGVFNGNNILKQFSEKLKSILLDAFMLDAYKGMNIVARLQNDEFGILLPSLKNQISLIETLSYIREATSCEFMIDGLSIQIATTAGAAVYPVHGTQAEELLNYADIAVYNAQIQHRTHAIYSPEMKEELGRGPIMLDELKAALEEDKLEIYYQPIIDLKQGVITGGESLLRFNSESLGLITAEKIIPLIEGTSLNKLWTAYMLEKTIKQLADWHEKGHKLKLNVNLSATDIGDPSLPDTIKTLLDKYHLSSKYFGIELTERACLNDQIKTYEILSQLASMGIDIYIEDFCSGYSSFIYLANFPINHLKIDKAFIMNMMMDDKKLKLIKAMIKVAKILDLKIVAIGVKDQEILNQLQQLDCDYGQGFYFSPAVSSTEFEQLFNKQFLPAPGLEDV